MLILKKAKDLENHVETLKREGKTVGFVPTMGALHQGHLALIKTSNNQCDITVCSIFINPTQFNDKKDFEKYPITIEQDVEKLHDSGCHILFLPSVKEVYPNGLKNNNPLDFGFLAETLEGKHRPGHFSGMAQVVERLLTIVKPHKLYMGQKDYQQQLIVAQLIKMRGLDIELITYPTVREKDGLAMSSRNVRLSAEDRKTAVEISRTLNNAKKSLKQGKKTVKQIVKESLKQLSGTKGIEPEYFEIRNAQTLALPAEKKEKLVALTAVKLGGVRLIDNMLLN